MSYSGLCEECECIPCNCPAAHANQMAYNRDVEEEFKHCTEDVHRNLTKIEKERIHVIKQIGLDVVQRVAESSDPRCATGRELATIALIHFEKCKNQNG